MLRGRDGIPGLTLTVCLCPMVPKLTRTMALFISNPDVFVFCALKSGKEHQRLQSHAVTEELGVVFCTLRDQGRVQGQLPGPLSLLCQQVPEAEGKGLEKE